MRRVYIAAGAALACGLLACARPEPGIRDDQFVAAIVGLRRAAHESVDSAAFAGERDRVLREVGVTEEQLREYIRLRTREPGRLAQAWDSASKVLRAGPEPDPVEE